MFRFSKLLCASVDVGIFIAYFSAKNVAERSVKCIRWRRTMEWR